MLVTTSTFFTSAVKRKQKTNMTVNMACENYLFEYRSEITMRRPSSSQQKNYDLNGTLRDTLALNAEKRGLGIIQNDLTRKLF